MSNVLNDEKKQQVIALGRLGWSLRRIQKETGVRRETVSAYLKEAGIALRPPRGRRVAAKPASPVEAVTAEPAPAKPASEVTTDSGEPVPPPPPSPGPSASACEPFQELIEAGLSRGRNAMAIWQDLVDQSAFTGAYESVKRFVRKLRGVGAPEPRAVILTAPGEEAQVDYGAGPMVRDPLSGQYRRMRLFVMTLGYSRKSVRLLTFHSSSSIWCQLHEQAFRRLGGVPRVVVLDNLREGVLAPDIYDPVLNPLYQDVLAHYGAVALACRV
ncbi:MAG TPA: DDE-type integrase/transposase/recombinase, partial [Terriglobia bacterium]|nr:DDE-type integrase/transposase/recombinase [Terriglobia bacterium]